MPEPAGTTSSSSSSATAAPLNLPDSKSPTLALVHPTPEEHRAQLIKNGVSWRGALSLGAYLKREAHLGSQPLTRDGGMTYWVLIDTAAKERLVLCGCETFRKPALVARNGEVQDVLCHGVGSVFCPKEHRGRGYAARMMVELGKTLENFQQTEKTPVLFSILYSDIGKDFYASHGWEPFNSSHISLHLTQPSTPTPPTLPAARPLYTNDIPSLCTLDIALLRKRLAKHSLHPGPNANPTAIALLPSPETIQWHHAREEFVAQELHCDTPLIKGAIVGTQDGKRVWCYWTRMWYNSNPEESKDNTLHILRLVLEDEQGVGYEDGERGHVSNGVRASTNGSNGSNGAAATSNGSADAENDAHVPAIEALLRLAQQEAQKWKMEQVEIWNPSPATVAAMRRIQKNAEVVDRDQESIASLMWYGGDLPGMGEDGKVAELIDWVGNEKYGWC